MQEPSSGFADGDEVAAGSDPLDPTSTPQATAVPALPAWGSALLASALLGIGFALGLAALLDRMLPTIELSFSAGDLALTLTVFTLAGVLGAAMPVARLRRIDPLETFRS